VPHFRVIRFKGKQSINPFTKYLTALRIVSTRLQLTCTTVLVYNMFSNLRLILFQQHMTRKLRLRNSRKLYYYFL